MLVVLSRKRETDKKSETERERGGGGRTEREGGQR